LKDNSSQWIASELTCRDVADRTSGYLENRLSLLTQVRIVLHLASCANCRDYVKQIAFISDAAGFLPKPLPSPINRLRLRRHFMDCHAGSQ
jgi:hypothetical protein